MRRMVGTGQGTQLGEVEVARTCDQRRLNDMGNHRASREAHRPCGTSGWNGSKAPSQRMHRDRHMSTTQAIPGGDDDLALVATPSPTGGSAMTAGPPAPGARIP